MTITVFFWRSSEMQSHSTWPMCMSRATSLLLLLFLHTATSSHYATLAVPKDASAATIKQAYRKIALEHHPDRTRRLSDQQRQSSENTFKKANEAFEVLSDPAQRRQYDFELANPIQQGEDGVYRRGEPGKTPTRPCVEIRLPCTLAQFGGWEGVDISLDAWTNALGAFVTKQIVERLNLPLRIYLPPGTKSGDTMRYTLSMGPTGLDVNVHLHAKPHKTWTRKGDDLEGIVTLSAWYRLLSALPVRIRGIDGERLACPRPSSSSSSSKGGASDSVITIKGAGMPIQGTGDHPRGMERGDLKVRLRVRGVGSELVLTTMRAGGVVAAALTANKARLLLPGLVGTAFDYVVWGYSEALSFLSVHGFGRNTPEAKRQRAVARAQRQGRSAQRRAEREATQARQRRAKRRKAFWSPLTEPVRKKAKVAKEAWETA